MKKIVSFVLSMPAVIIAASEGGDLQYIWLKIFAIGFLVLLAFINN